MPMRDEQHALDEAISRVARRMTEGEPPVTLRHAVLEAMTTRSSTGYWYWWSGLAAAAAVGATVLITSWPAQHSVPDVPSVAEDSAPLSPTEAIEVIPPEALAQARPVPSSVPAVDASATRTPRREVVPIVVSSDAEPIALMPLDVVALDLEPLALGPFHEPEPITFMPLNVEGLSF